MRTIINKDKEYMSGFNPKDKMKKYKKKLNDLHIDLVQRLNSVEKILEIFRYKIIYNISIDFSSIKM